MTGIRRAWLLAAVLTRPEAFAGSPDEQACVRESKERFGVPASVEGSKSRDGKPVVLTCSPLRPVFPAEWPKECRGTVAVHEVLVSPSGKTDRVWTIRTPCHVMDEAVRKAILDRTCKPVTLDGKPVPFCITVSTHVELR